MDYLSLLVVLAVEELMNKNAQVEAIIGPQTSAEVELFAGIAIRNHIPILSFSPTTSPALSSPPTRFFVRTAASIASQAAPIAAILDVFSWRAAVLLHEDSLYGIGILPALVHAFQVQGQLLAGSYGARGVVAGMMSEGYAWIATAGVGAAADGLSPDDIEHMQGVVSLRPYVQPTGQVRSFTRRLKARFRRDNPGIADEDDDDDVAHTSASLLWLYDTAWAAAAAADRCLHQSSNAREEHNTTTLVDGERQVSAYEVVNIIGSGARTVGFWTPELGVSQDMARRRPKSGSNEELKQILWPGETAAVPIGWSESANGRPLRVAVPVKVGFNQFVAIRRQQNQTSAGGAMITGFCIDVFQAVMAKLAYPVAYQYVPVTDNMLSYDKMVNLVHEMKADVVVADMMITAERMKLVSFTMPFTDSGVSMVVAEKEKANNMWIFLRPLTPGLWITSMAFFFFTGFVVWAIEHRINPRFHGTPCNQFGVVFYFAFSTLVFSHKEKLESNLSKLVVIVWVFTVLIITTSYTANLTSMLTVGQLQPTINELKKGDYVGYQQGSFVQNILKDMGFNEDRLRAYATIDQYAEALNMGSDNGGVSAIIDEVPYLKLFVSQYCQGYAIVGPTYKSGGFGFVFPVGSPLVPDVSRAIVQLAEENRLARIENKWFGEPGSCARKSNSTGDDKLRLKPRSFGGLFLINAAVSSAALLAHLVAVSSLPTELRRRFAVVVAFGVSGRRGGGAPVAMAGGGAEERISEPHQLVGEPPNQNHSAAGTSSTVVVQ
uniref:Glutamate receptor n=1 Tax=Oryza barthii TaxID=65489 RepID=A0A0D3GDN7_9ORYZ